MKTMTRHERCRNAIAGLPVDRTPTYMPALSCQVASKLLGRKAYCGAGSLHHAEVLAWSYGQQAHDDFEAQFLRDICDVQRMLDVDVMRMPWRINRKPTKRINENTFLFGNPDGPHEVWAYHPGTGDFGIIHQVKSYNSPEELIQKALADEEAYAANLEENQAKGRNNHKQFVDRFGKEFFVVSLAGGITAGLEEDELMALALEPELTKRRMDAQARAAIAWGQWLAKSGMPAVMLGGGDMASTNGPMYSAQSFRDVLLPAYKSTAQALNAIGVHYVFRSDGNLGPIADLLYQEAKVPGYGEVDRDAGMIIRDLRKRYPKLVCWGHVSSAFLASANTAQVKEECKKILAENGPSSYFHACSNAILQNTPPENVIALYSVR